MDGQVTVVEDLKRLSQQLDEVIRLLEARVDRR